MDFIIYLDFFYLNKMIYLKMMLNVLHPMLIPLYLSYFIIKIFIVMDEMDVFMLSLIFILIYILSFFYLFYTLLILFQIYKLLELKNIY